jgi:hypothetical protein
MAALVPLARTDALSLIAPTVAWGKGPAIDVFGLSI